MNEIFKDTTIIDEILNTPYGDFFLCINKKAFNFKYELLNDNIIMKKSFLLSRVKDLFNKFKHLENKWDVIEYDYDFFNDIFGIEKKCNNCGGKGNHYYFYYIDNKSLASLYYCKICLSLLKEHYKIKEFKFLHEVKEYFKKNGIDRNKIDCDF